MSLRLGLEVGWWDCLRQPFCARFGLLHLFLCMVANAQRIPAIPLWFAFAVYCIFVRKPSSFRMVGCTLIRPVSVVGWPLHVCADLAGVRVRVARGTFFFAFGRNPFVVGLLRVFDVCA